MSFDPTRWMWMEACEMLARAERLQRQFFQPQPARTASQWEPPVDVFAEDDRLWIQVALPGVAPEELDVLFEGTTLVVRGRRPLPAPAHGARLVRMEIPHGRFERRLRLPAGRYVLRSSTLEHGLLSLVLERM